MLIAYQNQIRPAIQKKAHSPKSTRQQPEMPAESYSKAEREELEAWSGRLRTEVGGLETLPNGQANPGPRAAHDLLFNMVARLAGDELTERDIELHLELFDGDIPQAALDDDMSREAEWKEDNPGKEWPIRSWFGVPHGSEKPIYRLVVNTGLLNTLETEDELAFVLAQQTEILLDHDRKDPYNDEILAPANQSFVDPREFYGEADRAAVARMNAAGYNPRGALSALEKLYSANPVDYPHDDLERGLVGAAHGQEHQGMRVGLVQAELEQYVRRGEPNTEKPLTPLSQEVKLDLAPEYQKPVSDPVAFQRDYKNLAGRLATDKTPSWMFGEGIPPVEMGKIRLAGGNDQDVENALVEATQHLAQSDRTSQQKVDGFLRLLLSLRGRSLPEEGAFSTEGTEKMRSFLQEHGTQWDGSKFFESLIGHNKSLKRSMVRSVVFNEAFQNIAAGSLPGLTRQVPAAWITDSKGEKQELDRLPSLIEENHSDSRDQWPLAGSIDNATLSFIEKLDAGALSAKVGESGISKAVELSNDLLGTDIPKGTFQERLLNSTSDLLTASAEVREEQARLRLRPPLAESEKVDAFLTELGQSETWNEFSPSFESDLPVLLSDLATLTSSQPDLLTSESRPAAHAHGMEKRLVDLLEKAAPEQRTHLKRHLTRHIQHSRRVQGHSPRREWLGRAAGLLAQTPTGELVDSFKNPDLAQHSKLLSDTLFETYNLKPEDLPNTSTENLRALNERVQSGEFAPKRENFASDSQHKAAERRYRKAQNKAYDVMAAVAPMESRLVLGQMALLGHDEKTSRKVADQFDLETFKTVLQSGEQAVERAEILTELVDNKDTEHVGADAGAFVMDGFLAVQESVESLQEWHDLASRSVDFSNGGMQARVGTRKALGIALRERLDNLEPKELRTWLGKDKVMELLSASDTSDLLVKCLGDLCAPDAPLDELTKQTAKLEQDFNLRDEYPVAYIGMRDKIAEMAQLQPHNVDKVLPQEVRGVTDTTKAYRDQARALSGLLAVARERSPLEQIDTIEYLMGRQKVMPAYLEKASEQQSFAPLTASLQNTRQDLLEADAQTRTMIANSFLAGPSGILRNEEGKEAVIGHFMKNLHPDNRELGEKIARAVLTSHGSADTLAVAFILGQKPEEADSPQSGQLDEATILNRLFDAYGVPGIKMKQYLAFTSEFSDFKDVFEDAQDSAMPLNYYEVLKLVQARFGDEWPEDLEIDRVLGSGSVNVAIRYFDEEKGKREVVSLGREDIEESTANDFKRFHSFIQELTKTPEDKENFGYVLGLLNLIEDSVALEFEKEQAMEVQQMAYKTYKHHENGWSVKSIDAHRVDNLGLFMEEASGKTARKVYTKDQEVYKEAMKAMAAAEFGVLKGQDSRNNWWPKELFANPDFHDGQVMIDEESKTVTILDFGQAVPISNEERKAGLDLLTIIGKADSPKAAAKRLNKRYFDKKDVLTPADLAPIMEREDRMDCFIHLLSKLSLKGADVPLSSIHWILGVNRQMALGEKIGQPIDKQVRNMVIAHKVWLPLGAYNVAHATKETAVWLGETAWNAAVHVGTSLVHMVGGWFGWEPAPGQQQQQAQAPKVTEKPEVSIPAWRPDFGGTLPSKKTDEKEPFQFYSTS